MSVLSIDVGITNLAMCLMTTGDQKIMQWDVSSVPREHTKGLFGAMKTHLDNRPWTTTASTILIERQPNKSLTIKSVEHFLHAYFVIKCPNAEVIIYDAKHKVTDVAPGKENYRLRKKASIEHCQKFLLETPENEHLLPFFIGHKKKDDLADTVEQARSWINRRVVEDGPRVKRRKTADKIVARKPTQNQIDTKYSPSNLAYLAKNGERAVLEKDKRFMKDLKKYFHSFDELISKM